MELLLLLFIPLALGGLFIGSDDDSSDNTDTPTEPNPETGGETGTGLNDILRGAGGDDSIDGGNGNDLIFGYRGDDTLQGGPGSDALDGGIGDDVLYGGIGEDVLVGAAGNDQLFGGANDDALIGGAGDDTLEGGNGDDILVGSTGADQMYGGNGNDIIDGVTPNSATSMTSGLEEFRADLTSDLRTQISPDVTDADIGRFLDDIVSAEGTQAPDGLYGGAGQDSLVGDNGDTISGGADQDLFAVNWFPGHAAVQITDYEAALREEVRIVLDANVTIAPQFGMRDASDGTGVQVLVGQEIVATLSGVAAADLDPRLITMTVQGTAIPAARL